VGKWVEAKEEEKNNPDEHLLLVWVGRCAGPGERSEKTAQTSNKCSSGQYAMAIWVVGYGEE
jgi:hypothetical protein